MASNINVHDEVHCEVERALGVLCLMLTVGNGADGKIIHLSDKMAVRSLWAARGALEKAEKLLSGNDMAN